jgi:hypothetical protein
MMQPQQMINQKQCASPAALDAQQPPTGSRADSRLATVPVGFRRQLSLANRLERRAEALVKEKKAQPTQMPEIAVLPAVFTYINGAVAIGRARRR